jgi:hypothetical protein
VCRRGRSTGAGVGWIEADVTTLTGLPVHTPIPVGGRDSAPAPAQARKANYCPTISQVNREGVAPKTIHSGQDRRIATQLSQRGRNPRASLGYVLLKKGGGGVYRLIFLLAQEEHTWRPCCGGRTARRAGPPPGSSRGTAQCPPPPRRRDRPVPTLDGSALAGLVVLGAFVASWICPKRAFGSRQSTVKLWTPQFGFAKGENVY